MLIGCPSAPENPYGAWPDSRATFPWGVSAETDLESWEEVRWETETWDPFVDQSTAAAYLIKASQHRQGAPPEVVEHHRVMNGALPPLAGGGVRLSFVGDVMWLGTSWSTFALPVAGLLDGDLRIGNLETPVVPGQSTDLDDLGLYTFNAPVELLDGLPLDALQLNNNHSLDLGDDGLEATLAEVSAAGFTATGVDSHATIDVGGLRIALLSYTWGLNGRGPSDRHELFVVPFGHVQDGEMDLSGLAADVAAAREGGADIVVVLPHWGFEYEYYADPWFLQLGRRFVEVGADLVVGHGPHVVQPAEICSVNRPDEVPDLGTCSVRAEGDARTAALLYSLGNFDTVQPTIPVQTGLVATVEVGAGGVLGMGWEAVVTVPGGDGKEVRPLAELAEDDVDYAIEEGRLRAHIGAAWQR
jgi:poly-gamma-glutamate capsule biosynthesis protein CapA/YwtB (metallophosphatase superfamily)